METNLLNPLMYNPNILNLLQSNNPLFQYLALFSPSYTSFNPLTLGPTQLPSPFLNVLPFMQPGLIEANSPLSENTNPVGTLPKQLAFQTDQKKFSEKSTASSKEQTETQLQETSTVHSSGSQLSDSENPKEENFSKSKIDDEKKDTWSAENIQLLLKWVQTCRYDWKKVARKFKDPKITPYQVKSKFRSLSQKSVKEPRIKFTIKEDLMLAKFYNIHGTDWEKIASHFEKRSGVMLKNRYYSYIRKRNLLNKYLETLAKYEETHGSPIEDLQRDDLDAEIEDN